MARRRRGTTAAPRRRPGPGEGSVLISLGVPFGRLPGDISYRRGNFSFHFPIVTSIIVSIILTLLFTIFRR